jgi:metacaspase-1
MKTSKSTRHKHRASGGVRRVLARLAEGDQPLRILCVHGVGHQENDPMFEAAWRDAITHGLSQWTFQRPFQIEFVAYDELFAARRLTPAEMLKAIAKLSASGLLHGVKDGIDDVFGRERRALSEVVRWTAGMVAQWAEDNDLRAAARQRVLDHTLALKPDVILAHSLGTLLSYDAFRQREARPVIANRIFVSFGSQIGNPFRPLHTGRPNRTPRPRQALVPPLQ